MRRLALICCIIIAALLGESVYMQLVLKLEPCPLCLIQRAMFFLLGIIFLFVLFQNPKLAWQRFYGALITVVSGIGIAAAVRQIWLQYFAPAETSACAPSLEYLLKKLPLSEAMKVFFTSGGDCAKVKWTFLSLSTPSWSSIFFGLFFIVGLYFLKGQKK